MQSEKELRIKLTKRFDFHTIGKVIKRLKKLNYVNDAIFAKNWTEMRAQTRGKKQIESELIQKGIDKEIILETMTTIDCDTELETARKLVKSKHIESIPIDKLYDKIGGYLARKGFSYEIIKTVLNENKKSCD
jgi:regulatory protein